MKTISVLMISVLLFGGNAFAQISRSLYQHTLIDQIQFVLCDQSCSREILKAAADAVVLEFQRQNVRSDFTASSLCNCNLSVPAIESLVSAPKARFVRQIARDFAGIIVREQQPRVMTDVLLDATREAYIQYMASTSGANAYNQLQIDMTAKIRNLTTLVGETSMYRSLIQHSFVVGSFRNAKYANFGCKTSPEYECLTNDEVGAAGHYMRQGYDGMNNSFLNGTADSGPFRVLNHHLKSLLSKLKPARALTFRGIGPRVSYENLRVGATYREAPFMSTSMNSRVSQRFMNGVGLILMTKTCPMISGSARLSVGEDEVLCPPGTAFRVLHREDRYGSLFFIMEEI